MDKNAGDCGPQQHRNKKKEHKMKLNMLHTAAGPETELQTALLRVTTFNGAQATEKSAGAL